MNQDQINQLKQAFELSPDNQVLQLLYFNALIEAYKWVEAEEIIKIIVQNNPNNHEYLIEYCKVLYHLNKVSQGILILENIIEKTDNSSSTYKLIIQLYLKENDYNAALKYYRKLLAIYPQFSDSELDPVFEKEKQVSQQEDAPERLIKLSTIPEQASPVIPLEKPGISFKDVGGMASVKENIAMKIINPIKHAELFKQYGKKIGGGILLYGPPGCGKTLIAKATAGEIEASFLSVGINDVLDMYLGQSEKQLHQIFEHARKNTPTVLFFDEVDALGASRNDMRNNAGRNIINQFLQELDGIDTTNDGILVLGATNAPWYIDNAFKRPGRFDRIIFIPPPDVLARIEILTIQLQGKPMMEVDIESIAKRAVDFTGADLKALVDTTIEEKLQKIITTGKESPINTKDFLSVIKQIKPSSKEWFETAKNYAIYSNQSGLYDDILTYLKIK